MLVRKKVDTGQFEWYRDNKKSLLPSQAFRLRRFFVASARNESLYPRSAPLLLQKNEKKKGDKVL